MNNLNKYFAFISYKREDEEWAVWFQHEMENYHLPVTLNGRSGLPDRFRPVFRDIDELKAGNLPEQIYNALSTSTYLIVICSPNSAKSKWVNKEITDFIEIGKNKGVDNVQNIFPFIVEGVPHAKNDAEECFPNALKELPDTQERIGGNVNESGRDKAFVKVLAGMMPNVAFDELWNRYEKDKAEKERIERERRDNLLRAQSRFVAEKAMDIAEEDSYLARLLAVEVLPEKLDNPNRPYTVEAERALRKACLYNSAILRAHTDRVLSVDVSRPLEKYILSASRDGRIIIWDYKTGNIAGVLKGHTSYINSAFFSPDGSMIVSASHDKKVILWDAVTYKPIRIWSSHTQAVSRAVFSPNGKMVASTSFDKTIKIWDITKDYAIKTLEGHSDYVNSVVFSPNGDFIVSVSDDGMMCCWNVATGELLWHYEGGRIMEDVCFSPDGKFIAIASLDGTCIILDLQKGKVTKIIQAHGDTVSSVCYSMDGKKLLTAGDKTIKEWTTDTYQLMRVYQGHGYGVNMASFNYDCNVVVSASDDKTVRIWNDKYSENHIVFLEKSQGSVIFPSYSPDGALVTASTNSGIKIWEVKTGKVLQEINGMYLFPVFNHTGRQIAAFSKSGTLYVLDVRTGKAVLAINGNNDVFCTPSFSFDGEIIAVASNENCLNLYKTSNGTIIKTINKHDDSIEVISFSPDGRFIASGSRDGVVIIENIRTGKHVVFSGHSCNYKVNSLVFHPNSKFLAAAFDDRTIIIWDVEKGKEIVFKEQVESVTSISFNQSGEQMVLAFGKIVKVWSIEQRTEIAEFNWPKDGIYNSSIITNNCIISLLDHSIMRWDFPPLQELIDQTRERFKDRPLTKEEKEQYYLE